MSVLGDALLAARVLKRDPVKLGGIVLRGAGPAREAVLAELGPLRRLPISIDDEALIGGRDLAATLAGRGSAIRPGLLASADGALLVVAMAERMPDALAARIACAMDTGEVVVERDGATARFPARFGLVLLDDGLSGGAQDERVPDRLAERMAFRFDLKDVELGEVTALRPEAVGKDVPASLLAPAEAIGTLAATAYAFGIDSARPAMLALRAAESIAALAGRSAPAADDVTMAARLVLAHRATRMPQQSGDEATPPPEPPPSSEDGEPQVGDTLDDVVLDAVAAALPPDVLAAIAAGAGRKAAKGSGGGERRKSPIRGRALGARAGLPRGGARLALIDTLRAAAPWQKLRAQTGQQVGRIAIRREDIRIKRFETRAETVTIFAVDASGSAAVARLAEAKGAVELLLAQAYVTRSEVALVAFRGEGAEVLLPPTRSLTRARRALADLPGGGGTPIAAGIDAARLLAEAARAKGRTPMIVMLSDGRANVGAERVDASAAGLAATGIAAVFVDISARPRAEGVTLAARMGARYLPLPRADARGIHAAVQAAL